MNKLKIYYVDIYGRENDFYGFRGKHVHSELVISTSQIKAKEEAWNNFQCDMSDLWKALVRRRDFRIECEDVTGVYSTDEQESTYWTLEEMKK